MRSNMCFIMRGLPGTGKSTYADMLVRQVRGLQLISEDAIRMSFGEDAHHSYNKMLEPTVRLISQHMRLAAHAAGLSVCLDDTHTRADNIIPLVNWYCKRGYYVYIMQTDGNAEEAKKARPFIAPEIIDRMNKQLEDSDEELTEYSDLDMVTFLKR